jgi:hypothetical protein
VHRLLVVVRIRLGIGIGLRRHLVVLGELVDGTQRKRRNVERLVLIERREDARKSTGEESAMPAEVRAGERSPS